MNDVVEIREVDIDRIRYEIESEKMIDRMEEVNMPMLTGFGG